MFDLESAASADGLTAAAARMSSPLEHRGPDDRGHWVDADQGIVFAHRRLAIIDLSTCGHQPMLSACGRWVLAYNGEVYNHRGIRAELERIGRAPRWRGHSDTEVLLAAVSAWGLRGALDRINGMFAFAAWDRAERTLFLCRDRMGEKPLYYSRVGPALIFGSELKALRAHPGWRGEVDREALALYFRLGYIPAPNSIYAGVRKLPAGTLLAVRAGEAQGIPEPYWTVRGAAATGLAAPFPGSDSDAADELEALLTDAVALRMESDVPLGAFLSGGIDSSLVVALMQRTATTAVRTFSIGFAAKGHDEAPHARAVAAHLGTAHEELYVTPGEAMEVIPRLPSIYDEPFGDPSQIPTVLLAQLARRSVTVSLSGDGGDELFGGYDRYFIARSIWRSMRRSPRPIRRLAGRGIRGVPAGAWNAVLRPVLALLPPAYRVKDPGARAHALANLLGHEQSVGLYRALIAHWDDPLEVVHARAEGESPFTAADTALREGGFLEQLMFLDQVTYLPDDILVKVDRATMAASLEARVPLLDHRLVELAWRLPLHMKVRGGTGKWLLRRVLDRHVPRVLVERPKQGFVVPLADWLRGPLRAWADALLSPSRLDSEGYLRSDVIRLRWREHLAGTRNWQYQLWDVLMFQSWLEEQRR